MRRFLIRPFRWLARQYPLKSGSGTIANSGFGRWLTVDCAGSQWAMLRGGVPAYVPVNDFDGRAIYLFGEVDPKISWVVRRVVRSGDTVIDIGANLGLVSLQCAGLVGVNGQVHGFEPNPFLFSHLEMSRSASNFANLHLHNLALGDRSEKLKLHVPLGHSGRGSLTPSKKTSDVCEVDVGRVDDYFQNLDIESIRLMKIDTEGHELQVLKGGKRFFDRVRPEVIILELNDFRGVLKDSPIVAMLREWDYRIFGIRKTKVRNPVLALDPEEVFDGRQVSDLVAIQRSSIGSGLRRLNIAV